MPLRPSPAMLAALCALAASIALSACGGSSSPSSSSASDSALKFSRCMREHGIKEFPDPEAAPGGGTRLDYKSPVNGEAPGRQMVKAAQRACGHFQEEGEGRELSPQQKAEAEDAVEKFARCMREHGIEVKTQIGGGRIVAQIGGPGPGPQGPNPKSPAFKAAQRACRGSLSEPKGAVPAGPNGPGA